MHSKDALQSTCKMSGWPWGSWTSWWFYFTNFTYGFRCYVETKRCVSESRFQQIVSYSRVH